MSGIDDLKARLEDISTPGSPNFGMHMTHEEIATVTATDASARVVKELLESKGAQVLRSTGHGEFITATWTVEGWEKLLSTELYEFEGGETVVVRAFEYTVPEVFESHVTAVLNVLEVILANSTRFE